jgi:hypothetical protein
VAQARIAQASGPFVCSKQKRAGATALCPEFFNNWVATTDWPPVAGMRTRMPVAGGEADIRQPLAKNRRRVTNAPFEPDATALAL